LLLATPLKPEKTEAEKTEAADRHEVLTAAVFVLRQGENGVR
jgi:hypothetical protein